MLNVTLESQLKSFLNIDKNLKIDEQSQTKTKKIWLKTQRTLPNKIQENESIKQLISHPFLLTLLRVVFEETGEIPTHRAQLYHAGLQILLKQWDCTKDVGDEIYKNLSLKQKEDLLSYVAWMTFSQGEYFFKQQQLEQYITSYLQNISKINIQPEASRQSKQVLQSIQAQYKLFTEWTPGIYAFSILSFHEYLAARAIVEGYTSHKIDQTLKNLVEQLTENRWHQIFVLVANLLPNADYLLLLMKYKIDALIEAKPTLQPFLAWLEQKSLTVNSAYKPAAVRAFYIESILGLDFGISCVLDQQLSRDLEDNSLNLSHAIYELKNCRLSDSQKQILQQYYDISKVLFDSMENAKCVTCSVREELEQSLFTSEKYIHMLEAIA